MSHPLLQFVPIRDPEREVVKADAAFIKRTHLGGSVVGHHRYEGTGGVHQRSGLEGLATRAIHEHKTDDILPPGGCSLAVRNPSIPVNRVFLAANLLE